MNKICAAPEIDFADAKYKSFDMSENSILTIFLNSWQEKPLRLVFFKTIQFLYRLGSGPKDLYEVQNDHSFLVDALLQNYGYMPTNHPFKCYQLVDIEDFPFIQVVAESVKVFKD